MSFRDLVLYIGYKEIGNSLKSNPGRVKEYIDFSCTQTVTRHLGVSWCTHFVHWVVENSGMIAKIPKAPLGDMSTGRIVKAFPRTTTPRPGDIYYMTTVNGKKTDHFGFVSDVFADEIQSLDGNSGDWRDPRTDWTSKYGGGIGGGMVCQNNRRIKEITSFYQLTPDD